MSFVPHSVIILYEKVYLNGSGSSLARIYIRNFLQSGGVAYGKILRGNNFEMLEMVLKIAGMIVSGISTVVKVIDLIDKFRHQKSNRPSPK